MELSPFVLFPSVTMLGLAFVLAFWRLWRGPDAVDRVCAMDLLTGTLLCLVLVEAVVARDENYLSIAVALAVIGFAGTVAFARFLSGETEAPEAVAQPEDPQP